MNNALMRPLPMAQISTSGGLNPQALTTPDPKEVWRSEDIPAGPAPSAVITIDLGAPQSLDTIYLGYLRGGTMPGVDVTAGNNADGSDETAIGVVQALAEPLDFSHIVLILDAPIVRRFIKFYIHPNAGTASYVEASVVGIGVSLRPSIGGVEYGAGRIVGDTGTAERLPSGGFAIEPGATYTGYQGTLSDLTIEETAQLYALLRRSGSSRTVLFIEAGPEETINERTHWGILTRLEPYERIDPLFTKWGFRIEDWA